jgi:hypothetical protein
MTKKYFIAIGNAIKTQNQNPRKSRFVIDQIETLADFLQSTHPKFKRDKWISFATGKK